MQKMPARPNPFLQNGSGRLKPAPGQALRSNWMAQESRSSMSPLSRFFNIQALPEKRNCVQAAARCAFASCPDGNRRRSTISFHIPQHNFRRDGRARLFNTVQFLIQTPGAFPSGSGPCVRGDQTAGESDHVTRSGRCPFCQLFARAPQKEQYERCQTENEKCPRKQEQGCQKLANVVGVQSEPCDHHTNPARTLYYFVFTQSFPLAVSVRHEFLERRESGKNLPSPGTGSNYPHLAVCGSMDAVNAGVCPILLTSVKRLLGESNGDHAGAKGGHIVQRAIAPRSVSFADSWAPGINVVEDVLAILLGAVRGIARNAGAKFRGETKDVLYGQAHGLGGLGYVPDVQEVVVRGCGYI
jgi:hypothetical protein